MGFIIKSPAAWPIALVPMMMFIVVWVLLGWASVAWLPDLMDAWIGPTESALSTAGSAIAQFFVTLIGVLLAGFIGFALAQPLSSPALESLVRLQERELGGPPRQSTSFFVDLGRGLQSAFIGWVFGVPLLVVLFIIDIIFPPAIAITWVGKLLVTAFVIAWDVCDYPLTVRGMPVAARLKTLWRHASAVCGFAVGLALAALIPCGLFLVLPGGVAGAARIMLEIERYEASCGRNLSGESIGR